MMPKIIWVLLPLSAYVLYVAIMAWRERMPSRLSLNVQTSLFLVAYLLTTAGLGIFWVANQQLPVFDWHYLFGYATLALVSVHLVFNLPAVLRWLKGDARRPEHADTTRGALSIGKAVTIVAALAAAFFLGTRQGGGELPLRWNDAGAANGNAIEAVIRYHEFSSESRGSVFQRAPGVDWGSPPPDFKTYADVPHVALSRGSSNARGLSDALRTPSPRTRRLNVKELGAMLYLSAGITTTRGSVKRAAPSSGNLFPSELYVMARNVDGLPAGVYHYDPGHDRLDALGAPPDTAAMQASVPQLQDADAVVVLASVFRRTGYKYRDRAYRYAVADAGHLLENLRIASHATGMETQPLPQFDEAQVAAAIGVDGIEEGVLAVVPMRRPDGSTPANRPAGAHFPEASAPKNTAIGVTGMVHQATSLRAAPDAAANAASVATSATSADIVALPAPVPAVEDAYRTITHRRSVRRFLAEPVPLAMLSSMLADMALPPQLSDAVNINVVVNRVDGLAPGVYRYLPRHLPHHALMRVRAGDFAEAAHSAALSQDVIGDAAVVLVLSADRARMLAEGARGYRHGYLEAGMIGERWLLGAVARGLAACPVGAFYDDEAAALIGVDPKREWVLHFAALGIPAER